MPKKIKTKAVAVAGDEELGRIAYEAYCSARNWKSMDGCPLPDWPAVTTSIQVAWMQSGKAVQFYSSKLILDRMSEKMGKPSGESKFQKANREADTRILLRGKSKAS